MVNWSASDLNSGTSPCCMLKTAMVWPVSRGTCGGMVSGEVAKVVVIADCRSCRQPVGLPLETCSLSMAQSIC